MPTRNVGVDREESLCKTLPKIWCASMRCVLLVDSTGEKKERKKVKRKQERMNEEEKVRKDEKKGTRKTHQTER